MRAFTHASTGIQEIVRNAAQFATMVRESYPMVWRPEQVRYPGLQDVVGSLLPRLMVTDLAGRIHLLDYPVVRTEFGQKINGAQLLKAPLVSA